MLLLLFYYRLRIFSVAVADLTYLCVVCCHFLSCIAVSRPYVLCVEKCEKNAVFFKLFWYMVFVHRKLKLLNFLVDSVLQF